MKKIKKLLKRLGPGFITGASDDDPSGIATYSQTGAVFGISQLWTALFAFPFMSVVQEMCGKIGIVTGKGLAGVIKKHYPKPILYFVVSLLLIANTINIGADLGAMASSAQLIFDIPFIVWLILIVAITLSLQIFVPYTTYAKILKYFALALLTYVVAAFTIQIEWRQAIISTFLPTIKFNKEYLLNIVAILGTTISPYLFFWQASEEVEEEVKKGQLKSMGAGIPKFKKIEFKNLRIDTMFGMLFSNIVMFFIILVTASTLGKHGIQNIETANEAAQALEPLAGPFAGLLFALGIIGTGLLAIPILSGSISYAVSETLGFKEGLYRKLKQAKGFYTIIIGATLIGLLINYLPIPPFRLLYYTAVLNGICAPPLLILIMLISNNKKIMGEYTNKRLSNILGVTITLVMSLSAMLLIATEILI